MDYRDCAEQILKEVGGSENITDLVHCMTRLRFTLKDDNLANDKKIKAIKGVIDVVRSSVQYQIIIGSDIDKCYKEIMNIANLSSAKPDPQAASDEKRKHTVAGVFNKVIDVIAGSIIPFQMPLMAAGMIKLLVTILGFLGVHTETNMTCRILSIIGDTCFYFFPILVAYGAAKKFNCNPFMAVCLAAVLIHPDLVSLLADKETVTFLGIGVTSATYSTSVIPAILSTWGLSYIERLVDRSIPVWAKSIFKPMIVLLIAAPITLIVLAPAGIIIGQGLQSLINIAMTKAGWLTMGLFAGFLPFIVMTGMHHVFTPGALAAFANGSGDNLLFPALLAFNLAMGSACMAINFTTKDKEMKSVASASGITALFGAVTEPALYGVVLPLKKPLIATCIGSGVAGLFIGLMHVKSFVFSGPSLVSIIQFISPKGGANFIYAVIAAGIAMVVSFTVTYILTRKGEDKALTKIPIKNEAETRQDEKAVYMHR
jgi:beta-glucoside PTS system EIICBA component